MPRVPQPKIGRPRTREHLPHDEQPVPVHANPPRRIRDALDAAARERNVSRSWCIERAIEEWLERNGG